MEVEGEGMDATYWKVGEEELVVVKMICSISLRQLGRNLVGVEVVDIQDPRGSCTCDGGRETRATM